MINRQRLEEFIEEYGPMASQSFTVSVDRDTLKEMVCTISALLDVADAAKEMEKEMVLSDELHEALSALDATEETK